MIKDQKIVARVTEEQRRQYIKLGGSKWLRARLEECCHRTLAVQSECGALEELVRQHEAEQS